MKNSSKRILVVNFRLSIVAILLMIIPACDDPQVGPDNDKIVRYSIKEETFKIGPEGGTIKALNGNVTLEIPQGALLFEEEFRIQEGPRDEDNDFIIKSIVIKPNSVTFNVPVGLSLKYDGQLSCGLDPCKAKSLALYHFKNEPEFDKRNPSDMLWRSKCYVNQMDCCLETTIYTGGVFAIGEEHIGQKAPDPF